MSDPEKIHNEGNAPVGVFITKGMRLRIPKGGLALSIGEDGGVDGSVTVQVSLDVCPYWLDISLDHLLEAEQAYTKVKDSCYDSDDQLLGEALEEEFTAGMQSIMAAAVGLDAFYAVVKENIDFPDALTQKWLENKTARYKQIAEVLKRSFRMSNENFTSVRQQIEEIMRFRDWAVHPPAKFRAPLLHPNIPKQVEWRFVAFRFQNAKNALGNVLNILGQLVQIPREKHHDLVTHSESLKDRLDPVLNKWEEHYNPLFERDTTTQNS